MCREVHINYLERTGVVLVRKDQRALTSALNIGAFLLLWKGRRSLRLNSGRAVLLATAMEEQNKPPTRPQTATRNHQSGLL